MSDDFLPNEADDDDEDAYEHEDLYEYVDVYEHEDDR
jgi:hypothetical protein